MAKNGYQEQVAAIFEEYAKSGLGENYKMVPDFMVDDLAICGTPEDIRKKLRKFVRAGLDLPILQFNPIGDIQKSFMLLVSAVASDMS